MSRRINYIDRMKGMAIFLVVMGHVYFFGLEQSDSIVFKAISSFHMPLFMFLSGLVACSGIISPYWSMTKFGRKLRGLLMPLLVFGICFSLTFSSDALSCIQGFLESPNKNGYWYLMSLAVFYVSLYAYRLNVKQKWFVDAGLAVIIWGGACSHFGNSRHKLRTTFVCLIAQTSILSLSWVFSLRNIDCWRS